MRPFEAITATCRNLGIYLVSCLSFESFNTRKLPAQQDGQQFVVANRIYSR